MSVATKLHQFLSAFFRRFGSEPRYLFTDRDEAMELHWDCPEMYRIAVRPEINFQFAGIETHETHYAEQMRSKILELPVNRISVASKSDPFMTIRPDKHTEGVYGELVHRVTAFVLSEDTRLNVTLEWDPWAKVKRALRLTNRFPIQTKTFAVDGRVLYPYFTVTLPHERHTVKIKLAKA
jgi:hypothetical protein